VIACLLILVCNVIGLIGFTKNWYNLIFGYKIIFSKYGFLDLTFRELKFSLVCFFFLFFLSLFVNFIS
jgi:hypothetical protein